MNNNIKLYMTIGLPACGKSTWCREQIHGKEMDNIIINRDSLRKMFHDSYWFHDRSERNITESLVSKASLVLAELAVQEGKNIYVDETNLSPKSQKLWAEFSVKNGLNFIIQDFRDVPLEVCLKRDAARDRSVGSDVIRTKFKQYINGQKSAGREGFVEPPEYNPELLDAVIFDIDGTLADNYWRSPYDLSECDKDPVIQPIKDLLMMFYDSGKTIILVSGRESGLARDNTEKWLKNNNIPYNFLFMRPTGDTRRDDKIKLEIYHEYIKGDFNVLYVLDDRNRTVDGWRSVGLKCLQCAPGDF